MGNSFIWDRAVWQAYLGNVNYAVSTTKMFAVLGNATAAPTTANKQGWYTYNDIKYVSASAPFEINTVSTGYALGGNVMSTAAPVISTDTINFGATAQVFTAATNAITAQFLAIQYAASSSTTTTNPLLSNHDLQGTQSVTNGTLTLTWPSNIAFSWTSSAAT
jgi:hypothetical protein